MRVWSDRLGYFAAVGSDISQDHREQLERLGIDLRGLIERVDYPTARAWQLFETEARRVEVFRTDIEAFYWYKAQFEEMPPDYFDAQGFHLHFGTLAETAELAEKLRAANPTACLVWEPTQLEFTGTGDEFRAVLSRVDLVSPDLDEARQMTRPSTAEGMAETLLGWGCTGRRATHGCPRIAGGDGRGRDLYGPRGANECRRHNGRRRRLLRWLPGRSWQWRGCGRSGCPGRGQRELRARAVRRPRFR